MTLQEKRRAKAATLKNPTPVELPSGKWRCQVMVDGERKSVVEDDPEVAYAKALALKSKLIEKNAPVENITVGAAIDRYIESKDSVLSPATIKGYKKIRANDLQGLMDKKMCAISQEDVQREVNKMAKEKSAKSVKNAHGLLSSVLTEYRPTLVLRTTLPQKQKYDAAIPSIDDIEKILKFSSGKPIELPILLAVWLGLRQSEIRGLTWGCIDGNIIHIKQAIVDGEKGPELKGTKTYSGNRKIRCPQYIIDLINNQPKKGNYIVPMSGHAIYNSFSRVCAKAGVPHFRFHDLRHINASVMLSLNIPDKYAMERMGHATTNMLKTVYQHTMKEKQDEVSDLVDNYFALKLHTDLHTKLR